MDPPLTRDRYSEDDFDSLGFHDCYVYGFKWDSNDFSLLFDIDYIVKWAEPIAADQRFQFWISPAELCFKNIADTTLELNWAGFAPQCRINELQRVKSRTTPNGTTQWYWEFELAAPRGAIALWATGFELRIQAPPSLSPSQQLPKRLRN
jgi:hypothetical protein